MARVLWTVTNQLGALLAGTPILLELRDRGHDVVALSTPQARAQLAELGFGFRPHRRVAPYDWTTREGVPARLDDLSFDSYRRLLLDPVPDQAADVLEILGRERFDLVMTDGMSYGAGLAAEKADVPWACYVAFAFDESISFDGPAERARRAAWDGLRASVGLGPDTRPPGDTPWLCFSPYLTLLLGLPELAFRRSALPKYVQRVGPVIWDPPTPTEPPPWLAEVGRDRPLVVLSTSSAWVDEGWLVSMVGEALADEDVDVVATVPADHDLPALPANVRVARYLPHRLLIPAARVVICSGSYGVTTRAASVGVPLVVVPCGGDGHCVALAAARAGIGIALDPGKVTAGGIRAAVHRVMSDTSYGLAAARLADSAQSYDAIATAADAIEQLLP
jgi:UDP:flavonoid glycosyltransferase YjiC (YdhE family)